MKRGDSPAQDQARRYLTAFLNRLQPGARLSSLNRLARMAQVSRATMWKSVQECVREGSATTRPGGGIYVSGAAPETRTGARRNGAPCEGPKWQRVAASIVEDIRTGVYKRGAPLPAIDELQIRYRVSYPTIAKCLKNLVAQRQIIMDRSRFRVPSLAFSLQHKTIVFIARAMTRLGPTPVPQMRTQECFTVLETESLNAGLHLSPLLFDYRRKALTAVNGSLDLPGSPAKGKTLLGFALSTEGLAGLDFDALFSRIQRFGQPLAILDQDRMLVDRIPPMSAVRLFTLEDDLQAGLNVGRFLLGLGHRTIGYITPYHTTEWALRRYQGLLCAADETAMGAEVVPFRSDTACEDGPDEEALVPVFRLLVGTLRSDATPPHLRPVFQGQTAGLRHALSAMAARNWMQRVLLAPLEKAMQRPDVTAWVAPNDAVATQCLEFLGRRSTAVPQAVSVVGFDDGLSAQVQGLTSYNFGITGATHAMLSFLLHPARTPRAQDRLVTISGFVHERETTSPPRLP